MSPLSQASITFPTSTGPSKKDSVSPRVNIDASINMIIKHHRRCTGLLSGTIRHLHRQAWISFRFPRQVHMFFGKFVRIVRIYQMPFVSYSFRPFKDELPRPKCTLVTNAARTSSGCKCCYRHSLLRLQNKTTAFRLFWSRFSA